MPWWTYALLSAVAAAATALLAKVGVTGVPSNLATAIRTVVVLVFAWTLVFIAGEHGAIRDLKPRTAIFLALSGLATGVSWLAYFKALQLAPVSKVAPIDKLSLALTIGLAALVLGERLTWKTGVGTGMIVAGVLLTSWK